jgi:hypothetical protein
MNQLSDKIASVAIDFHSRHGSYAIMLISDEISRAIGKCDWDMALHFQRVRYRYLRMERSGHLDAGTVPSAASNPNRFMANDQKSCAR